jgi:outer membrane protein TolC
MKKSIKIFFLVACCATLQAATAQQCYTLDECRELALAENARIKTAQGDLAAAGQEKKEAFTNFLPSISAIGIGMKADDGLLQLQMSPDEKMKLMDDGLGVGVTATLPIYAGGVIYNGNKLAQIGVEVNQLKLRQTQNEISLTVEQYYWQIVVLKAKLQTIEAVELQLGRISKDVEAAVEAGVTNRNDLLQVNLRKNDIRSTRIDLENNLSLSKIVLAQFVGVDETTFDVASTITEELPQSPGYLYTDHDAALEATPEYQLLNKNVEAAKLQKRLALGEHLPKVALGGGYLYNDFMGFSQNRFLGYVSVTVPISWKAPYSVKKQRYRYQNAQTQLTDGGELLVIRMQKAWNDLDNAYQQVQIAANSIEQATENLRLNEDYYKAGTSTMSDLMDAQTLFRQSHDRYAEAWSQYEIKKLEYLQATGR